MTNGWLRFKVGSKKFYNLVLLLSRLPSSVMLMLRLVLQKLVQVVGIEFDITVFKLSNISLQHRIQQVACCRLKNIRLLDLLWLLLKHCQFSLKFFNRLVLFLFLFLCFLNFLFCPSSLGTLLQVMYSSTSKGQKRTKKLDNYAQKQTF